MGSTECESMLQLAAEAFHSRNFDLAADIYQYQLATLEDRGGRLELLLKRADALAFGGKLAEAFDVYRQAAEVERLRPAHLARLVEYLSGSIRRQDWKEAEVVAEEEEREEKEAEERSRSAAGGGRLAEAAGAGAGDPELRCRICQSFLFEPVTLPCGHCFCRTCLEKEKAEKEEKKEKKEERLPVVCRVCRGSSTLLRRYRVNVVLSCLLAKWFPSPHEAARLRREGNGLYAERRTEEALEKYDRAISMAPLDHILLSNRSQIHCSLRQYEKALQDAEVACRLMPHWPKGHIRRAQALVSLGRMEEALREFLVCLAIEPDCRLAKAEAHKLLSDLLAPVSDQVHGHISDFCGVPSVRALIKSSINTYSSQAFHDSQLSSEVGHPSSPGRKTEGCEGEAETRRVDHCLILKRKRTSTVEEVHQGGTERNSKRSKIEPSDLLKCDFTDIMDPTDLDCSLCMRLFYEPVTTPCGHTFCLRCLERCLDHNSKCPLCKEELSEYLAQRQYCKTVLMEKLISKYFPAEFKERQKVHLEEMAEFSNLNKNVPIFVCTMAFPTVPCPLHIFEPCYRLMIRRCMEAGTKCFGMCLADNLKGFADYGCLLEIRDVKFFSDGRSVVDTIGRRRFRVVEHSERDGYQTADIEYLEDVMVEGVAERELRSLHDTVYDQALVWVNSLKSEQKQRIEGHFGPMPRKDTDIQTGPNGPSWCWWLLAVLPLDGRAQLPFLALTSLKDRLSGIRKVLLFMAHSSRHR